MFIFMVKIQSKILKTELKILISLTPIFSGKEKIMNKTKMFFLSLSVLFVLVPSLAISSSKNVNEKAQLSNIKTKVLRTIPREPKHVDSSEPSYKDIEQAFVTITKYQLGRFKEIQNLLLHWSKKGNFSTPPLANIYAAYEKAVFTMPGDKILDVYIDNLQYMIDSASHLLVNKPNEKFMTNTVDSKTLTNIDINLLTERFIEEIQEARKNLTTNKKKTPKVNEEKYFKLITSFKGLTKEANQDTRVAMRQVLNKKVNDPLKVFFPPKDEFGGGLTLKSFLEIIDQLNWKELYSFARDVANGKYDPEIKNFEENSWMLDQIKQKANDILKKEQH